MNEKICQHDINVEPNTIRLYRRRFMVMPDCLYGTCEVCNSPVEYIKTESGYVIAKEGEDENQ